MSSPHLTVTAKPQLTAENHQQKNAGTYEKRYLTSKDKRSHNKMVGGAQSQ